MVNQVVTIDRKKYAVGLFWQPLAVGSAARNYARNLARGVDKKLNLYTEYRSMVGLGSSKDGHRTGMPSVAAEVMESFAEFSSFLAVFQIEQVFWLVAVRNGIIIDDRMFVTEDAAKDAYTKLSAMPDWGSFFAPGEWGMPRSVERNIIDVVTGNVKATLKPISRVKSDMFAIGIFLLFALGVGYFFREPIVQMFAPKPQVAQIDPLLAEEYKKQIELKNQQLDQQFEIQRAQPPAPLVLPYEYLPDPMQRAEVCYQAIGFLMQPVAGWVQTDAECTETHANVTFRRSFGTLGEFYEVAGDLMPGAFVQEITDSEIFVRAKLPDVETSASIDEKDAQTVVREVNTLFQMMDVPVDTNVAVDIVGDDLRSVSLNVVEVGTSSKLTPPQFIDIFNELQGVYMTRAAWDARSKTWNYEVIIYAK